MQQQKKKKKKNRRNETRRRVIAMEDCLLSARFFVLRRALVQLASKAEGTNKNTHALRCFLALEFCADVTDVINALKASIVPSTRAGLTNVCASGRVIECEGKREDRVSRT